MRNLGLYASILALAGAVTLGLLRNPKEIERKVFNDRTEYADKRDYFHVGKVPCFYQFMDDNSNGKSIDFYRINCGNLPECTWSPINDPNVPSEVKKIADLIESDYEKQEEKKSRSQVGHELFGR